MRIWVCGVLVLVPSVWFLCPDRLGAQDSSSAQGSSSATGDRKESKKQARKFGKEAGPAYDSWLRDEVPDIITEEERRAFLGLATNEEREQFIESFWQRRKEGVQSAVLDLYGPITTVGGRVAQTFEDVISRDIPDSLFEVSRDQFSIYQKWVPLRAGLYRIDIVIKDTQSGKVGVVGQALRVPRFEEDKLDASSLILADQIEPVATKQTGDGQFVLDAYRVRPRLSHDFGAADKLGIYLQLYNLKREERTHETSVSVAYRITKERQEVWHAVETPERLHQGGEQLTIERLIPASFLPPGHYTFEVTAIDLMINQTVVRSADFRFVPAPSKPASTGPAGKEWW
jgi:hypothetical protein